MAVSLFITSARAQDVVINEIMYHPSSQSDREEYIELLNRGAASVNLSGWKLDGGVRFDFPAVTLGPGQYLVVAADAAAFWAKYGGVTNFMGDWRGQLRNSGEAIELLNASGIRVDWVPYSDEGEWAVRELGPLDHSHRGWIWSDAHDGGGRSLELISPAMPNEYGQNWAASQTNQGTPGTTNSVLLANIAPLIVDINRIAIVPRAGEVTTVTARIIDETAAAAAATLYHRIDGAATFSSLPMLDDGLHGDGAAGDGVFGAVLPGRPNGTIIEYYLQANDGMRSRTAPAPALVDATTTQVTNFLYIVPATGDMQWTTGTQPLYHIIMTNAERAELALIGDASGGDRDSDAQMNATFLSLDADGVQARYNAGVRNRGHGTRSQPPMNYHINFRHDQPWQGVTALNINSKYTHSQVFGSAIFQQAGVQAADVQAVHVRVNGQDLAEPALRMFGSYAAKETFDDDYVEDHFPSNDGGNFYSCFRFDPGGLPEAELRYEGTDPNAYRDTYFKQTNEPDDDWSDLIRLTYVLNNAPDATYFEEVSQVIDVEQWVRYVALDMLLENWETGLVRGYGDDYAMYRGIRDPRFVLVPHDLDTLLGQGNSVGNINHSIFTIRNVDGLNRLFSHPEVVSLYYRAFFDLTSTVFSPQQLNPLIDQVLGSWVPAANTNAMKQYAVNRTAAVLAQIPQTFSIQCPLPLVSGYYRSTLPRAVVYGTAHAAYTRSVLVNGQVADWAPITAQWSIGQTTGSQTLMFVRRGSVWRYLDNGSNQGTAWRGTAFNDSGWSFGPAQLGYGDGDEATVVSYGPTSSTKYITTYFRHTFTVADASDFISLTLRLLRDDGAVVYLNGSEVVRDNMTTATITYTTRASTSVGGAAESQFFQFSVNPALLVDGANVLAVEIHQNSVTSTDISFDLELEGQTIGGGAVAGVALFPGINRVIVRAFEGPNGTGNVRNEGYIDIWYDVPAGTVPIHSTSLMVRSSYLPGIPFLVRVEALDANGNIERDLWDAVATLSANPPSITLSSNQVILYNGLGSALVTATGSGDFTLTATLAGSQASRTIASLQGAPIATVSGTLPGTSTTWTGIVRVTSDLLVPSGHTLTLLPGTLVLLNGIASGETGTDIDVRGSIQSLGTETDPITFTAFDPAQPWGEIHHEDAAPSLYQYTNITRAGNSPRGGHTNTGPMVRPVGSTIVFDHCNLTDAIGKVMQSSSASDLTFRHCHLARSVMGPEIAATALLFEDNWITEMFGPDDDDAIYIHSQQVGQTVALRRGVLADTDDDGLDTLGSTVTVEDYIIRDIFDKGVSVYGGQATLTRVLLVHNSFGISAKERGTSVTTVNIDHATIANNVVGIQSEDKFGQPGVHNYYWIKNSIVWGNTSSSIQTDYDPADIHIDYSDVAGTWPGTGNLDQNPLFVASTANNYRLLSGSPCINTGDPASPLDPDGSRTDMGFFTGAGSADSGTTLSGTLLTTTTLTPGDGPYYVPGDLIVSTGTTLTLLPGVTLFFYPGTRLLVYGRLLAEGSEFSQIRFTRLPGTTGTWGGIQYLGSTEDNRITYAVVEYGVTNNGMIGLQNANLLLDHVTFDRTDRRRIRTINSSLIVRHCNFVDIFGPGQPPTTDNLSEHIWGDRILAGGQLIIEENVFGTTKGHNDAIDFSTAQRPGPIPQILNNLFAGGGDEALDVECDAHIEGNVFRNFHKDVYNTDPGQSNVISAGSGRDYVVVRNTFVNVDHVSLVKDGSFMTFENNTVATVTMSALYFDLAGQTAGPGRGAYVDGCIFYRAPLIFDEVLTTTDLTVNRSIVTAAALSLGVGNTTQDPMFVNPTTQDFHLLSGSPAIGAGPNGLDMGALVPAGASISGEPPRFTSLTDASLTIDGPGITAYRFSLDGGSYGSETAIDVPLLLTGLADGDHRVLVIGKNSAAVWQSETSATRSMIWTINSTYGPLKISELMYNPVDGEGFEFLELHNAGSTTSVNLSFMRFTRGIAYTFPDGACVEPQGHVLVVNAATADQIADFRARYGLSPAVTLYGPYAGNLDNGGERVTLETAGGIRVLSFDYDDNRGWPIPADGAGHSLVPLDTVVQPTDWLDYGGNWRFSTRIGGSPGAPDPISTPTVVLNEVMAHTTLSDPRYPAYTSNDWIEIHNLSASPVSLDGWYLSDDADDLKKWPIFTTATIAAGDHLSFDEITAFHRPITAGFGLDKNGEQVFLSYLPGTADDRVVDAVDFMGQENGVTLGRHPSQEPYWYAMPSSRGQQNTTPHQDVIINEIMYHPADDTTASEYLELFNPTAQTINMWNSRGPWRIAGGADLTFPPGTALPFGRCLLIVNFDPADIPSLNAFKTAYGQSATSATILGPYAGNLSNKGERIALERPLPPTLPFDPISWVIVDEVIYFDQSPWTELADGTGYSLQRLLPGQSGNDPANWNAGPPSPGEASFGSGYALTIIAQHGTVQRMPNQLLYGQGAQVSLSAVPDPGYLFAGWSGDVPSGHQSDNPLILTMDANKILTANFQPLPASTAARSRWTDYK